jgi:hypothetical protein
MDEKKLSRIHRKTFNLQEKLRKIQKNEEKNTHNFCRESLYSTKYPVLLLKIILKALGKNNQ